jgi:hypothetical protein
VLEMVKRPSQWYGFEGFAIAMELPCQDDVLSTMIATIEA